MHLLSKIFLVIMCLAAFQLANAYEYVNLVQFNSTDGLNSNEIRQQVQDKDGALWIRTNKGINRYDGYRIETIESPDNLLTNNYAELIFEDSTGLIWFGVSPNKNFVLNKSDNSLKEVSLSAPSHYNLSRSRFKTATEDDNYNIWFSTRQELFYFDKRTNEAKLVIPAQRFFSKEDTTNYIRTTLLFENFLFIGTTQGLYAYNTESKKLKKIIFVNSSESTRRKNNVKSLLLNKSKELMIGTVEGLFKIDPKAIFDLNNNKNQEIIFPQNEVVQSLNIWVMIEKENFYWLATNKGLYCLSKEGNLKHFFKYSDTKFNTHDDNIISMLEDREGNLWLGSRADGLFKWFPNSAIRRHFWTNSKNNKLSNDYINTIKKLSDGYIWAGTLNGLNKINSKTGEVEQFLVIDDKKMVASNSSIFSFDENKGKLWLRTSLGLRVLDLKTMQDFPIDFPQKLKNIFKKSVYSIGFIDEENLALFSVDGVYNYNLINNTVFLIQSTETNSKKELVLYNFFDAETGEKNTVFVAGYNKVVKYNKSTQSIIEFHSLPYNKEQISRPADVFVDNDNVWISYSDYGLYLVDRKTAKTLKVFSEKELNVKSLSNISSDDFNNIWITTHDGFLRLNKSTFHSKLFGQKEGFATSQFNRGAKVQSNEGNIYLGSVKGIFEVDVNKFKTKKTYKLKNHITNLNLMSKNIKHRYGNYNNQTQIMSHNDFGLEIKFSAFLLEQPKNVKYYYSIEGDSPIEEKLIEESQLFFPSLPTGENILKISAIDYNTGEESEPATLSVIVLPPPWLSPIAFFIYGLLTLLLVIFSWTYFRYKNRKKKIAHLKVVENEERLQLALEGSNSGLWDWHAENNMVYEPRMFDKNAEQKELLYKFEKRINDIHANDREEYQKEWLEFLQQNGKEFVQSYRMRDEKGNWLWYRDTAKVTEFDSNNNPIRVTGTYSNITRRKKDREQMQLYSKALENTRDIIIILNKNKIVIAANQAFYRVTKRSVEQTIDHSINFIVDDDGNSDLLNYIFENIDANSHWKGEGCLMREGIESLPVLITTTIFSFEKEADNYVFTLSDISHQKVTEEKLKKLANYDSLTKLPNRALLIDRIKHAIEHATRYNQKIALFFIDLDRFKRINDTLGHDIGDLLLKEVAKILNSSVRSDDTVARLGGDEFVIMLEYLTDLNDISHIAEQIIEKMKKPLMLEQNRISISPSIGISVYPEDGVDASVLLKNADIAMYHAKTIGRNNFQYFKETMNDRAQNRLVLENALREAIKKDQIYLEFQPQFSIQTGKLKGMEGLARWKNEEGNMVSPAEFIPLAEDLGLIIELSEKLLTKAIKKLSEWHSNGIFTTLAFNLSAKHLQHYELIEFVEKLIQKYPIKTELLEFELTESILMEDADRAKILFNKLADKGIKLALDDFGTGYSSLKYLTQLPIKKLKIDKSFVDQIHEHKEGEAVIRSIITLAQSLKMKSIAEGIETESQLEFLKQAGVDDGQGYLLSRPLPLEKMEELLESTKNFQKPDTNITS